ncbi:MAG: hypothetical protein Q9190_004894 [Brigantiaea leucoxantha]
MPFIPHTPESLLSRSDSKNPATTCKGITSEGRPCRRNLAVSPRSSPRSKQGTQDGVLAVLRSDHDDESAAAAFFCWQHKDQAAWLTTGDQGTVKTEVFPLKGRTSIDTLAERLGILNTESVTAQTARKLQRIQASQTTRPRTRENLPRQWQNVPEPLLEVPGRITATSSSQRCQKRPHPLLSFLCCSSSLDDQYLPSSQNRSAQRSQSQQNTARMPTTAGIRPDTLPLQPHHSDPQKQRSSTPSSSRLPLASTSTNSQVRPALARDPSSRTEDLLAWIPRTLSPQITSQLLTELAKPISELDEDGYIYMFWLTPMTAAPPTTATVISLLPTSHGPNSRRQSANSPSIHGFRDIQPNPTGTILLKIGRATNVQRRMNEWRRQCGYDLSIIRYYPYRDSMGQLSAPSNMPLPHQPSASSDIPPSVQPRGKVPHVHRVERLIHIELAEQRITKPCEACGREHREWFEVNGDRAGVRAVHEVIKRWVKWGERSGRLK